MNTGAWIGNLYLGLEMMGELKLLFIVNKRTVWNKRLWEKTMFQTKQFKKFPPFKNFTILLTRNTRL